jgi:mannose-1-phosphate guanylyltransferase
MDGNIATNMNLHLAHETHNTLVYGGGSERLVVTIGVDDTVIVDTQDILLVCKTDQSQKVKDIVEHLRKHGQEKYL